MKYFVNYDKTIEDKKYPSQWIKVGVTYYKPGLRIGRKYFVVLKEHIPLDMYVTGEYFSLLAVGYITEDIDDQSAVLLKLSGYDVRNYFSEGVDLIE